MKTLQVSISEIEFNKFGLTDERLSFTEIIDLVAKELTRQNLEKTVELAEQYGLSNMTIDEITAEVNAVRANAKNRH